MENTNLPKTYNPKDFESRLYSKWVEEGLFKSKPNPNKKPFTILHCMILPEQKVYYHKAILLSLSLL